MNAIWFWIAKGLAEMLIILLVIILLLLIGFSVAFYEQYKKRKDVLTTGPNSGTMSKEGNLKEKQ